MTTTGACYQCLGPLDDHSSDVSQPCQGQSCSHSSLMHAKCLQGAGGCPVCHPVHPKVSADHSESLLCVTAQRLSGDAEALRRFLKEVYSLVSTRGKAVAPTLYSGMACELSYVSLSNFASDPPGALLALRTLIALARSGYRDPDYRLGAAEGPYRLCRALDRHKENLEVMAEGLEAVSAVLTAESALLQSLEEAGVFNSVLQCMRQWLHTDVRIWTPGLHCIRSLLHHNMDTDKELGLELVVVLVQMVKGSCDIAVVKDSPLCKEVQCCACETLAHLCTDEASAQVLLDAAAPRALCILLTKSRADAAVQQLACRAVCNLSLHSVAARGFFGDYLPALVKRMLEAHREDVELLESAMKVVTAASSNHLKNAEAFGNSGMCECVLDALRSQLRHANVVLEATRALGALAFVSPANARRLLDMNAAGALEACRERHSKVEAIALEVIMARKTLANATPQDKSSLPPVTKAEDPSPAPPAPATQAAPASQGRRSSVSPMPLAGTPTLPPTARRQSVALSQQPALARQGTVTDGAGSAPPNARRQSVLPQQATLTRQGTVTDASGIVSPNGVGSAPPNARRQSVLPQQATLTRQGTVTEAATSVSPKARRQSVLPQQPMLARQGTVTDTSGVVAPKPLARQGTVTEAATSVSPKARRQSVLPQQPMLARQGTVTDTSGVVAPKPLARQGTVTEAGASTSPNARKQSVLPPHAALARQGTVTDASGAASPKARRQSVLPPQPHSNRGSHTTAAQHEGDEERRPSAVSPNSHKGVGSLVLPATGGDRGATQEGSRMTPRLSGAGDAGHSTPSLSRRESQNGGPKPLSHPNASTKGEQEDEQHAQEGAHSAPRASVSNRPSISRRTSGTENEGGGVGTSPTQAATARRSSKAVQSMQLPDRQSTTDMDDTPLTSRAALHQNGSPQGTYNSSHNSSSKTLNTKRTSLTASSSSSDFGAGSTAIAAGTGRRASSMRMGSLRASSSGSGLDTQALGRGGPDTHKGLHLTALQETGFDMTSTVSPVQVSNSP